MLRHTLTSLPPSKYRCTDILFLLVCALGGAHNLVAQTSETFTCGKPSSGSANLTSATRFKEQAAGWDLESSPNVTDNACGSDKPFFFSVPESDGNYQVKLTLGGPTASIITVKAESRRLMLLKEKVPANGSRTVIFNVNVRSAPIAGDAENSVKLKPREVGALDWDNKLTLEFNGIHPSVRSIEVKPVKLPTVYIAGDSTVVDQDKEPWAAWGQMLPVFFKSDIVISNQAESGETIKSFVGERRLAKVMSTMQPGDYLLIQFGHNDQKPGTGYVPAETMFKDLLRSYIDQAHAKDANVILVTPMNRRNFDDAGHIEQTLGDFPQAFREIAVEKKLGLVDLNAMSKTLFESLGPDGTLHAFVHYPANTFPDQAEELKDNTHFNSYGAYLLAECVVQSIKDKRLVLEKFLKPNIPRFDPAHPPSFSQFTVPASPFLSAATPYGR